MKNKQRRGKNKIQAGEAFGRLTTIKEINRDKNKNIVWECICRCGNKTNVVATLLSQGHSKSCGCLVRENLSHLAYKHGMSKTKIYRVWAGIISRTSYKGDTNYQRYGGRGIKVCDRWRKYLNFFEDMGREYREGLQIERVNNDGNYEPSNCKWATRHDQSRNKRVTHFITFNKKTQSMRDWSEELKINYDTLRCRINDYGWAIEKAFTTPTLRRV